MRASSAHLFDSRDLRLHEEVVLARLPRCAIQIALLPLAPTSSAADDTAPAPLMIKGDRREAHAATTLLLHSGMGCCHLRLLESSLLLLHSRMALHVAGQT